MDNNYQNNMNTPTNNESQQNAAPQAGAFTQQYQANGQNTGSAQNDPQGAPVNGAPETEPKQPKPKKKMPLWLTRTIFAVVIAALAVGGGYTGASLAYQKVDRVVVERVTTSDSASTSAATTDGSLTAVDIAAKTEPSVVSITTERMTTSSYWFGSQVESGAGSGVVISEDGYILTCDHVIEGADTVKVQLSDGTVYDGTVVGQYPENDIAVVKIDATGLTAAEIADSDQVIQGETVYAVGNPEGRFSGSISDGLISATSRDISMQLTVYDKDSSSDDNSQGQQKGGNSYYNYWNSIFGGGTSSDSSIIQTVLNVFQTSAPVSPGNSGGGLFNARGQLIGIVNAKSSDSSAEGLGFAIPSNKAMEIANSLISTGSYTAPDTSDSSSDTSSDSNVQQTTNKAILGIQVQSLTGQQAAQYNMAGGVYITAITEKSTEEAGLAVGDRLISVDGVIVNTSSDVTGYLADKNPGDVVTVAVERDGKMVSVEVTLVENASASESSNG